LDYYLWIKALQAIAAIAWMAGMHYLPLGIVIFAIVKPF
jgi:uncharacterized membrane protein